MSRKFAFVTFIFFFSLPAGLFAADPAPAGAAAPAAAANPEAQAPAAAPAATVAAAKERDPAMATAQKTPLVLSAEGMKELENRERAIAEKEKELTERENAIQVQERILQNKLKRIEEVSKKMAGRLDRFKEESEGKVGKMVTMLENMKPDAAAAYIENVDPFLAVEVMARINVQKAAKIWNKMDKKISARLSELYTGFRTHIEKEQPREQQPAPKTVPAADKG